MTTRRTNWKLPTLGISAIGAAAALPLILGAGDVASAQEGQLQRFSSCSNLSAYARDAAIREMRDRRQYSGVDMAGGGAPTATTAAPDVASDRAEAGTDYSTTNVQIAGIDEPDIVKTDGTTVYALAGGRLYAVDATGDTPRVTGSVTIDATNPQDMLLTSDGAVIAIGTSSYMRTSGPAPTGVMEDRTDHVTPRDATSLTKIDVRNPGAMRVVERFGTDADYVSARMADGTIRVVLRSNKTPIPRTQGTLPGALSDAAYLHALERSPAEDWLPTYRIEGPEGTTVDTTPLAPCETVSRTVGAEAGTSTLTVLTIDPDRGLEPVDRDTVMGDASEVMMSGDNMYVTTGLHAPEGDFHERTAIHVFDTSEGTTTEYRGSGAVDGRLLNQFSMDEHDGVLRVATTRYRVSGWNDRITPGGVPSSDSAVTTLAMRGNRLMTIGEVAGLGRGERIYSVRFMGDRGYVVTFRETDPLYTVDLSVASRPRVTGELKIPGYSAYLHPISDTHVIGIGQDATEFGQRTGTQVSLFDTSDPERPRQVDKWTAPGTGSQVEWNHHAFLWWAPKSLAVLPVEGWWRDPSTPGMTSGAVALNVTESGIGEARALPTPAGAPSGSPALRSLVVNGRLLTLSRDGITSRSVDTLDGAVWTPLA